MSGTKKFVAEAEVLGAVPEEVLAEAVPVAVAPAKVKKQPHRFSSTNQPAPERRRPRGPSGITARLVAQMQKKCKEDPEGRTWADLMAEALIKNFMRGKGGAIQCVLDRVDGKLEDIVKVGMLPQVPQGARVVRVLAHQGTIEAEAVGTDEGGGDGTGQA